MTGVDEYVTREYKQVATRYFKLFYLGEQWAGDVAGYWMHRVPLDEDLAELKFELGKMAYDECRHLNIIRKMIRRYGGQEAVDDVHSIMHQDELSNVHTKWLHRQNQLYIKGPDDFIEFLVTLPMMQEGCGIEYYRDIANCTPDPVLEDTARSIVEDELMHGSIGSEFVPLVIEKFGDEARESLQRGINRWTPILFSGQGRPENRPRQFLIDAGFADMTAADIHEHLYNHLVDTFDGFDIEIPDYDSIELLAQERILPESERILKQKDVYKETPEPRQWEELAHLSHE